MIKVLLNWNVVLLLYDYNMYICCDFENNKKMKTRKFYLLLAMSLVCGNSASATNYDASPSGAIHIYNGTSYLNGSNYGFYNNNGYSLVIKSCVSLHSKGSNSFTGSKITSSNNTWLSGYGCSDFVSESTVGRFDVSVLPHGIYIVRTADTRQHISK